MPTVKMMGTKDVTYPIKRITDEVGLVHGGRKVEVSEQLAAWLISTGRAMPIHVEGPAETVDTAPPVVPVFLTPPDAQDAYPEAGAWGTESAKSDAPAKHGRRPKGE